MEINMQQGPHQGPLQFMVSAFNTEDSYAGESIPFSRMTESLVTL